MRYKRLKRPKATLFALRSLIAQYLRRCDENTVTTDHQNTGTSHYNIHPHPRRNQNDRIRTRAHNRHHEPAPLAEQNTPHPSKRGPGSTFKTWAQIQRRAAAVENWRRQNGDTCPGWHTPPHQSKRPHRRPHNPRRRRRPRNRSARCPLPNLQQPQTKPNDRQVGGTHANAKNCVDASRASGHPWILYGWG